MAAAANTSDFPRDDCTVRADCKNLLALLLNNFFYRDASVHFFLSQPSPSNNPTALTANPLLRVEPSPGIYDIFSHELFHALEGRMDFFGCSMSDH